MLITFVLYKAGTSRSAAPILKESFKGFKTWMENIFNFLISLPKEKSVLVTMKAITSTSKGKEIKRINIKLPKNDPSWFFIYKVVSALTPSIPEYYSTVLKTPLFSWETSLP